MIFKDVFGKHMYTAQVHISHEAMIQANVGIRDMVMDMLTKEIAREIANKAVLYRWDDIETGDVTFSVNPVFMDSEVFSKLVNEYVKRVIDNGKEDSKDTSRRNPRPLEFGPPTWFESDSDKD